MIELILLAQALAPVAAPAVSTFSLVKFGWTIATAVVAVAGSLFVMRYRLQSLEIKLDKTEIKIQNMEDRHSNFEKEVISLLNEIRLQVERLATIEEMNNRGER